MNHWDEIRRAINEAREADRAVEAHARSMGSLLRGKCRHLAESDAAALKRELQEFNIHTGKWKRRP